VPSQLNHVPFFFSFKSPKEFISPQLPRVREVFPSVRLFSFFPFPCRPKLAFPHINHHFRQPLFLWICLQQPFTIFISFLNKASEARSARGTVLFGWTFFFISFFVYDETPLLLRSIPAGQPPFCIFWHCSLLPHRIRDPLTLNALFPVVTVKELSLAWKPIYPTT